MFVCIHVHHVRYLWEATSLWDSEVRASLLNDFWLPPGALGENVMLRLFQNILRASPTAAGPSSDW